MNKQRVIEVIDTGLSSYEFTERHKHDLMMQMKRENFTGKRKSIYLIAIVPILLVVIAFVIALINIKP